MLRPFRSCLSAPMQASHRCCRRSRCQRCAVLVCAALRCMLYKFCVFNCDVDGSKTSLLGNKQRQQRRRRRRPRRSIVSVSVGIHPFSSIALSPHDYFYNTLTHSHDELSAAPEKQTWDRFVQPPFRRCWNSHSLSLSLARSLARQCCQLSCF